MAESLITETPPVETVVETPPVLTPEEQKVADDKAAAEKAAAPTLTPEEQKVADDKAAAEKAAAPTLTPEEQKVADDKAAADKKEADEKSKAEGAPETYEDFKLPEGMEMDKAALEKFLPLAKKHNLSQEAAQEFVDLKTEAVKEESQRQFDAWEKTQDEWVADSKSDKDIGGEKFQENLGIAKKAIDAYGNEALKDLADATGMGNNKEFLRFCINIGKDIIEDKLNIGGSKTVEGSRAARIYDHVK